MWGESRALVYETIIYIYTQRLLLLLLLRYGFAEDFRGLDCHLVANMDQDRQRHNQTKENKQTRYNLHLNDFMMIVSGMIQYRCVLHLRVENVDYLQLSPPLEGL